MGPKSPTAVRPELAAVTALTLLGAILRLHRLDAVELGADEIDAVIASAWSIPEYLRIAYEHSWPQFPAPVWILKGLIAVFGDGEFVYRLIGFIPGTLAIPALYALGKTLFTREVGLVAAALLVLSPTGLFVSQEVSDCRKTFEVFKTSAAAQGLAIRMLQQGKATEAEPLLAFAADQRRDNWESWRLLGKVRQTLGRNADAVAAYETAVSLPNASGDALLELVRLYDAVGDRVNAHEAFVFLARKANEPRYWLEAARLSLQEGRNEAALQESLPVAAQQPDWPLANLMVAQTFDALDRRDEGYPYAVKAAALQPDDVSAATLCARYYAWFRQYDQAEAVLRAALQFKPDDSSLKQCLHDVHAAAAGSPQAR